ncbi:MAG: hypothetical protein ABJ084_00080 [Halioglobus sp.]
MTEYELADAVSSYATQGGTFMALWISILSAYAFVAYTTGEKLLRSQVIWINCLYVFTSFLCITAIYGSYKSHSYYTSQIKLVNPNSPQSMYHDLAILVTGVAILGSIATLKFMWDVRHPKAE